MTSTAAVDTSLANNYSKHDSSMSFASAPLGAAMAVPVAIVAVSCLICTAVALDQRLHQMCFYYFLSLAALNTLMAVSVLPAAVYVVTAGSFSFSDAACKLWISGDLFYCNNACLHLAFINMDAFLRLKDPRHRRGRRVATACSLMLWLGAPWSVSFVQSVAQFMLSQADPDSRSPRNGLCFIADKNFVVLGALFAFFVPVSVAIVFAVLCQAEVHMVERRLAYCVSDPRLTNACNRGLITFPDYQPEVDRCETISDDVPSVETSGGNESPSLGSLGGPVEQTSMKVIVRNPNLMNSTLTLTSDVECDANQLEVDYDGPRNSCNVTREEANGSHFQKDSVISWHLQATASGDSNRLSTSEPMDEVCLRYTTTAGDLLHAETNCVPTSDSVINHLVSSNADGRYRRIDAASRRSPSNSPTTILSGMGRCGRTRFNGDGSCCYDDELTTTGSKLLDFQQSALIDDIDDPDAFLEVHCSVTAAAAGPSSAVADEGLRQELDLFRTTRKLLVTTVLLWLPLTVANVVYATCENCRMAMTVGEVMAIKWFAYISPLVGAIIVISCSELLRNAVRAVIANCFRSVFRHACNRRQAPRSGNGLISIRE